MQASKENWLITKFKLVKLALMGNAFQRKSTFQLRNSTVKVTWRNNRTIEEITKNNATETERFSSFSSLCFFSKPIRTTNQTWKPLCTTGWGDSEIAFVNKLINNDEWLFPFTGFLCAFIYVHFTDTLRPQTDNVLPITLLSCSFKVVLYIY